jgi:23S rRNA (cytidine1920-2'-O)/16S rRNA (cytidine1409-2'-O)-methyltransferase
VTRRHRAPFGALTQLLQRRHLEVGEPDRACRRRHRVVIDGTSITNQNARLRSDASIPVVTPRRLRGELNWQQPWTHSKISVAGAVCRGHRRRCGWVHLCASPSRRSGRLRRRRWVRRFAGLRADNRVVNFESTNVGSLDRDIVPEVVDLATIDLSYLPVAEAVQSLRQLRLGRDAALVAVITPTFGLGARSVVTDPRQSGRPSRSAPERRGSWLAPEGLHGPCDPGS